MEKSRPRILVLTFTEFTREPRALKQVEVLQANYDVTTAGYGEPPFTHIPHIELPEPNSGLTQRLQRLQYLGALALRRHRSAYRAHPAHRQARATLAQHQWDLIIAHDVVCAPLAAELKSARGVLVDLHEYAPLQNEHSRPWRWLIKPYYEWILRRYVAAATAVSTVGNGIQQAYRENFAIDTTVVVNATPAHDLKPQPVTTPIKLVHSGITGRARRLDLMIEAVIATRTEVTLDFFLMPTDPDYLAELQALAANNPRIRFNAPVPYRDLVPTLNRFDAGITFLPPTTFNLEWCLPNKFFDNVQARIGVITGPSPEMANYVRQYGFGTVTADFSVAALTAALDELSEPVVTEWKHAAHRHADALSSASQMAIWAQMVADIFASAD